MLYPFFKGPVTRRFVLRLLKEKGSWGRSHAYAPLAMKKSQRTTLSAQSLLVELYSVAMTTIILTCLRIGHLGAVVQRANGSISSVGILCR